MLRYIIKLFAASKHSWQGLKYVFLTQWAFRLELLLLLIAIPCSIYLGKNASDYALLLGSMLLILMAELFNSAIEVIVNRIGLEYNTLSGLAKDLGSAGVLLACLNAALIWLIILIERLS